jgi:hypothetical protein
LQIGKQINITELGKTPSGGKFDLESYSKQVAAAESLCRGWISFRLGSKAAGSDRRRGNRYDIVIKRVRNENVKCREIRRPQIVGRPDFGDIVVDDLRQHNAASMLIELLELTITLDVTAQY